MTITTAAPAQYSDIRGDRLDSAERPAAAWPPHIGDLPAAGLDLEPRPDRPTPPAKPADAPLTKIGRAITAAVHAAVLVALLAFVVTQLYQASQFQRNQAVVSIVAGDFRPVTAPVDGVFQAEQHLPAGTFVQRGETLGVVASASHQAELTAVRDQLETLKRRPCWSARVPRVVLPINTKCGTSANG